MTGPGYKASAAASNINVATLAFDWSAAAALVAAGDFAILAVSSTAAVDTPSGWASAGSPTTPASRLGRLTAFTKTLVSGDLSGAASFQLTAGGDATTDWSAMLWIGGPGSLDVVMATDVTQVGTAGTSVQAPSISPVSANTRCVWFHGTIGETGGQQTTWTADGLTTERRETTGVSGSLRNTTLMVCDALIAAAGATGVRTATASASVRRAGLAFAVNGSGGAAGDLVPAKLTITPTSGSPTLSQAVNGDLTASKATITPTMGSPTLTQAANGTLTVSNMSIFSACTQPTLALANLVPSKLTVSTLIGSVTLQSDAPDPVRSPVVVAGTLASDGPLAATLATTREVTR